MSHMEDIARVRAALSEGHCPRGHKLSHGGGLWGSCDTCRILWTVTVPGYMRRDYGRTDGHWSVTEQGEHWVYEFTTEPAGSLP